MTRPPAYQCYANDLLALFVGLSLAALGAVQRIFLVMWGQAADHCSMVDDDAMLARTVGVSLEDWKGLRQEIQHPARPLFEEKDGRLISVYLRREAAKQRKYRKLQAEKSKKAVAARVTRGLSAGSSTGEARGTSSSPPPTPTPTPTPTSKEKKENTYALNGHSGHAWEEDFKQFWAAYPKKKSKANAERWFATHRPSAELVDQILTKIAEFKTTDAWQEDKGKYVPYPSKWLDAKGWEDVARVDVPRKPRFVE